MNITGWKAIALGLAVGIVADLFLAWPRDKKVEAPAPPPHIPVQLGIDDPMVGGVAFWRFDRSVTTETKGTWSGYPTYIYSQKVVAEAITPGHHLINDGGDLGWRDLHGRDINFLGAQR